MKLFIFIIRAFIAFLFTVLIIVRCKGEVKQATKLEEMNFKGWFGQPENRNSKPYDYYYSNARGRASEKAIAKKNGAMMQVTCEDYAKRSLQFDLKFDIVWDTFRCRNICYSSFCDCKFREESTYATPIYSLISCTENSQDPFTKELFGSININYQQIVTLTCRPLAKEDPDIPLSEYKECECSAYVYFKNGKEELMNQCKQIQKKFTLD